ncbi:MAG: lamin tail domain-containing protein [Bacteroidia bacterium]|nr:lamin tail domain-containing protein [Bacteroidia bacterium]NNJ56221.1 hypothetical protein [Bacteroidia bacterium]
MNAQISEDFSDGDLTSNPTWSGNTSKFMTSNGMLQSASTTASDVFSISTPISIAGDAEWEFWVNLKLSTSSANYSDIFLVSDSTDVSTAQNGFFVRVGNTKDEVSLYKLDNGVESVLINGADGKTHNKEIRIKVTKEDYHWELWIDYTGGSLFALEATGTSFGSTTGYFGILVKQSTATFHQKHYFDDIYVGPKIVDTTLAAVTNIDWIAPDQLELTFDDIVSNSPLTIYSLSNGYGIPDNVTGDFNTNKLILSFSQALTNGSYTLSITNLFDVQGNNGDSIYTFSLYQYVQPKSGDVVFSEIFADPTPTVGLPEEEFIELFNTTPDTLTLEGCTFSDGGNPAILPNITLEPWGYLILCKEGNENLYTSFGSVEGLQSFPTLNNSGDDLELRNNQGDLLDRVSYTDTYYRDEIKKQGGYSLELIDTANLCSEHENWNASTASLGGTPGFENSVWGVQTDTEAPTIIKATITDTKKITVWLDEALIQTLTLDLSNFELVSNGTNPIAINNATPLELVLEFQNDLINNSYLLTIKELEDCKGNASSNTKIPVVRISSVNVHDILINELLFNPNKDGVDFIELYNASENYISFDSLQVGSYNSSGTLSIVQLSNYILSPKRYVALSIDSANVRFNYPLTKNHVEVDKIPAMNDDKGNIVVYSKNTLIDSIAYSEDQHFELLSSTEGVSLERINFKSSSLNSSNWTSASSSVGFATPGYQNSQFVDLTSSNVQLELETKVFSPDGDSYEDILSLKYTMEDINNTLNGYVYNLNGVLIDHPFNNETISTTGNLFWDGIKSNGDKIATGNYVLFIEVFNLDGKVENKKLAFSVTGIY